jgi:hypothetical protein
LKGRYYVCYYVCMDKEPKFTQQEETGGAERRLYRYEARRPDGGLSGMIAGGFDLERLAKKRGISSLEASNLREQALEWLNGKFTEGRVEGALFFFTEEGKKKFDEEAFSIVHDSLIEGWTAELVMRDEREVLKAGNVTYEDEHQKAVRIST